ncbi:MAG: signal recognition particle protein [Holosporaceae bacterium]|jgi:signal recognition particle subunit SRP54|nr:signal recognition particle protein [Holosporaceae bacterium]
MFDSFSHRISGIFEKLRRSGILRDEDVDAALREIRIALLEADVSLPVAKKFIEDVRAKAIGQNVIKSISPEQMVTKIVHDCLVELLGAPESIEVGAKPHRIMLVGLQGVGKTTTAGKLAKLLSKNNRKIMLTSTDIYRPAAIEQLRLLSKKIPGSIFCPLEDENNLSVGRICSLSLERLKKEQADALIVDTAGRLHIDEVKMDELAEIKKVLQPQEVILVVDVMIGQDAFNIANKFLESLGINGIILTRLDGDARGGVALSMRALTGCAIKFLCAGERLDDIDHFDAERIARKLLGMGDVVSLVEKAQEHFSSSEASKTAEKLQSGIFTFDDFADQMRKVSKLGGIKSIMQMLPQARQLEGMMETHGISDKIVIKNLAIINSMTKKERMNYRVLNGSRKRRIASGSGTTVQEVNRLLKQYKGTLDIFKKMKKSGGIAKIMSMMGV